MNIEDLVNVLKNISNEPNTTNVESNKDTFSPVSSNENSDPLALINGLLGGLDNSDDLKNMVNSVIGNLQSNESEIKPQNLENLLQNTDLTALISPILKNSNRPKDPKSNLLFAAKPFIGESYSLQVDRAIRLVNIARTAKVALRGFSGKSQKF